MRAPHQKARGKDLKAGASRSLGPSSAILVLLLLAPLRAHAHAADEPHDHERFHAPLRDREAYRSPRLAAFELRLSPYRPRVDSEFAASPGPFEQVFGTGESFMFGFEVDYQALRIPHFGSIGPGLGAGFVSYSALGQFADGTGTSAHSTQLWIVPLYLGAVLRIDVLARDLHVPLVPYGKVALQGSLWEGRDAGRSSVEPSGKKGQALEGGWSVHGGLMLELNFLAPESAVEMDASTGINSAYLFGEYMFSDVNSFGKGMQVGGSAFVFGLAVEY